MTGTIAIARTATVGAPPEEVFALLLVLEAYPRWVPHLAAAAPLDPPPLAAGARVRLTGAVLGRTLSATSRLTAVDAPRLLAGRGEGPLAVSWSVALQPAPGGTLVRLAAEGAIPWPLRPLAARLRPQLEAQVDEAIARFRRLAEGG